MKSMKKVMAGTLTATLALSMAACGGTENGNGGGSEGASGKTTLEVWAWEPTLSDVAEAFEEKNPDITINITNVGTATDQYTSLNNALSAGSGAPDIAQVEYYAVAQYAISNSLMDLSEFGAAEYGDFYTPGTWSSVSINGGVYGLPMDSGPMALFYNKEVFDRAGVTEPPTTMEEYYEAAKKIRSLGPDYYITCDSGEPAPEELMMWVAGGTPFQVDGENLTINLTGDEGVQQVVEWWQRMVDEDLIDTHTPRWSDDWSRKLNDGTCASLTIGAWMASMFDDNAPDTVGKWRAAATPVFDESDPSNGEDGGSTLGIMASSDKAEAAWKFIDFAAHSEEGIDIRVDQGQFPADNATLESPEFLEITNDYFGDQKYNEVLSESAAAVSTDWQFLPYDVYARSIFGNSFGPAALGEATFADAVAAWEQDLIEYGKQQGYTVNE